ncbi:MAG: type IV toxin-antitoxin system AbiEi family antitoxin [Rhodobacteraceae bacterium]|nr:type IV toxin-antitoxin system AbiEi family antitoxin [Paracoccaceae bacterium]
MKPVESTAVDAVCALLEHVPNIESIGVCHKQHPEFVHRLNARIDLDHDGNRYTLLMEIKPNGAPRFARSAVYQLESCIARLHRSGHQDDIRQFIPILVSPYLSPDSRSICLDHNVAYLDLYGNAHLAFGPVYIERSVPGRPKSETRSQRSLFTPRAGAILRVLLRDPARAWRVKDLAEAANASLGHVSNVRKTLLDREWVEIRNDGLVLAQPDALLKSWRENYRQPTGHHISGYTVLHGDQLRNRLSGSLNTGPQPPRAICASISAAEWISPYVRGGTHSFYADEPGARILQEALQLTHAGHGTNVILRISNDETLFEDAVEPAPGIFCANPVVTYLDLWSGNDRDREAADHLAMKCFPWL